MNMFTPTDAATPAEYIDALPEPRRADVRVLDALIRREAPGLEPHLQSGMLAYGHYRYKPKSGVVGDWFFLGLSGRKTYVSLYVMAEPALESFRDRLPKADIGRSCVRIKRLTDVDLDVVADLVRQGAAWVPPAVD